MIIDECKTAKMLSFLEGEHFRHRRRVNAVPSADEIDLSTGWSLDVDTHPGALLSNMRADFVTFMSMCMHTHLSKEHLAHRVTFRLDGTGSHTDESFKITVGDDKIDVTSAGERGLLHASHYLERQCALRGGPFLKKGTIEKSPAFDIRISNTVFCSANGNIDEPIAFTDKYLGLMSHLGINGVHIYVRLWDYCRNSHIPELNTPDYDRKVEQLRLLCERTGAHGIDVYLTVRNEFFPDDALVFDRHPSVRGAAVDYPVPGKKHCLCSSNPVTVDCYNESFANLFQEVPTLGGVVLIVGGEGFIHCFTRPKRPFEGRTNCPNCSNRNPDDDVASLINGIAASIHSTQPSAKVFAWPYSAFTWSGEDFAQTGFIRGLNQDVELLSNFETPGSYTLNGRSAALLDYNICDPGPSEQFKTQSRVLEESGKAHYAKIESSTEPGWFFLPYLPLYFRWIERIMRLKEAGVPGLVTKWRFYGFVDCIPDELLCEATWGEDADAERLLLDIARRDFSLVSEGILEGWKRLSAIWDNVPAGHMIWGERNFYMKGPVYLGPAHPLIFDAQNRYDLISPFFTLRGDLAEACSEEELVLMEKDAAPRYSSDLLFTHPFGAGAVEQAFQSAFGEWFAATRMIEEAIGSEQNERAQMELNICRIMGAHLQSAWNVTRFYRERDALFSRPADEEALVSRFSQLVEIADDEILNAESALSIIEGDTRIGYGYCYGQVYDADMVRDKIRQCTYMRDIELPALKSGMLFHVHHKFT